MKNGMLITFLITLCVSIYLFLNPSSFNEAVNGTISSSAVDISSITKILYAATIVSGVIYLSILFSKNEDNDLDGDGI
jgi:hypothetical protein